MHLVWQRLPCKVPTAHQEQFRVQCLAQGHTEVGFEPARSEDHKPTCSTCWATAAPPLCLWFAKISQTTFLLIIYPHQVPLRALWIFISAQISHNYFGKQKILLQQCFSIRKTYAKPKHIPAIIHSAIMLMSVSIDGESLCTETITLKIPLVCLI